MAVILRDLYQRYCLTSDDVKILLLNTYNIQNIHDDLVLDDEQAEYLINTIYGKIDNDVDIHYEGTCETDEIDDRWYDDFDEEDDYIDYNEEDEDTPDCPPKSQLPYTHGRLSCPYCGQTGDTYVDGTAYCPKCRKWYCYA